MAAAAAAAAATSGARSPMSSPRLPSPPPIAEDQTGPRSPLSAPEDSHHLAGRAPADHASSRRIRPGTKAADINEGPPLTELSEIDSAFQLTEHLKALHQSYTHPPHLDVTQPITRSTASVLASVPAGVDRSLWLYELCRFLVQRINIIIISLFTDSPPCSASTCPEMRASEWQYLCAVHDPPKSCCAIDYCCHTIDWAANILTSPTHFPSRLKMGPTTDGSGGGSGSSGASRGHQERQLTNVFRRVYRILAHAWFQHRDVFWRVESRTGLYVFFKTVCDSYALIPEDNYTIPASAEGSEGDHDDARMRMSATDETTRREAPIVVPAGILQKDSEPKLASREERERNVPLTEGATAKRHRHAPSSSVSSVLSRVEENEEGEGQQHLEPDFPHPSASNSGNDETSSSNTKGGATSGPAEMQGPVPCPADNSGEETAGTQDRVALKTDGMSKVPGNDTSATTSEWPHERPTQAEGPPISETAAGDPSAASRTVED